MTRAATVEHRIVMEYAACPQLALTLPQAKRLWDVPDDACESALRALVAIGYLEYVEGRFLRRDVASNPQRWPTRER